MIKIGPVQQKILLLVFGGLAVGLASGSPTAYLRTIQKLKRGWDDIDRRSFNRSLKSLYRSKLVVERKKQDGTVTLVLTKLGERRAVACNLFGSTIKVNRPKHWDGFWRIVMFDIPERSRVFRDILREHLREIGFIKLQQSVFVYPFPCEKQMLQLIELYGANRYVRVMTVKKIDNDDVLAEKFEIHR